MKRASKHPDPAKDQSIKMREARTKAQAHDMTKEEFRAQTPPELRGPEQDLAATPRQQWQPIETVPKDGTEVIVVDVNGDQFIASSTDGHNLCDGFYPIDRPTHWMPLPEPPTQNEKQP